MPKKTLTVFLYISCSAVVLERLTPVGQKSITYLLARLCNIFFKMPLIATSHNTIVSYSGRRPPLINLEAVPREITVKAGKSVALQIPYTGRYNTFINVSFIKKDLILVAY